MKFATRLLRFVFLFLVSGVALRAVPLTAEQKQWLARAGRHEKAGWIYVHIEGEPRARGFQHGYLLAKEIAEGIRVTAAQWLHDSSFDWAWLIEHTKGFIN